MSWKIEFYNKKVESNLRNWPAPLLAKFIWISEIIETFGPADVGMPHVKPMKKGLFEIRVKASTGIGRVLFCLTKNNVIVILNEFIKKSQKTPLAEIELAKKRMAEVKK